MDVLLVDGARGFSYVRWRSVDAVFCGDILQLEDVDLGCLIRFWAYRTLRKVVGMCRDHIRSLPYSLALFTKLVL